MKDQVRTPLRTVLRNFLNHIEKLESSCCPEKSYEAEFQDLKLFSESVKTLKEYACTEGEKETNRKKNRYKDILPFDISRVVLNEYAGIPGSDYINANFIKGASGSPAYIASQGPLPSTVNDFWRMVVQCEVQVIVMACNEEEAGKAKCEKYWVDDSEEKQFGMISVKLLKSSTVCPDFSVRTMRLKYTNSQNIEEERTVCQLHYVAWPDHGVPTNVQPLLEMVRLVRDTQASETLPVLVHCSAGCGRTGTICAIDYVWGLLRTGKLTDDFSLLTLIREMRKQRIAMVQTKEQYVLVHQAVRELFKEQLLMIDSHPYENIDIEGLLIIKEEENHYDTVEHLSSFNVEEKKDNTMEKDVAPPLPQKKHSFYSSKQEKDVENLSAQQRSINKSNDHSPAASCNLQQSLLAFEVHHSLAPQIVPKKPSHNPIPSKGILRVPNLKSLNSSAPVKRSKSLKLSNTAFKQRGALVSAEIPAELKRRSLESNFDDSASVLDECIYNEMCIDEPAYAGPSSSSTVSSVGHSMVCVPRKYDLVRGMDEKRLLVRSLTTFDLRQKRAGHGVSIDDKQVITNYSRCRLARSNTQVDFSRVLHERTHCQNETQAYDLIGKSMPRQQYTEMQAPLANQKLSKRTENVVKFPDRRNRSVINSTTSVRSTHQNVNIYENPKPSSSMYKITSSTSTASSSPLTSNGHYKERIKQNSNPSMTKLPEKKLPSDLRMLSLSNSNYGPMRLPSSNEALYSDHRSIEAQHHLRGGPQQHLQVKVRPQNQHRPGDFLIHKNNGDSRHRFLHMNGSTHQVPMGMMNKPCQGIKPLRGLPNGVDSSVPKKPSDVRFHNYGKGHPMNSSYASTSEPSDQLEHANPRYADAPNIYAPLARIPRNPGTALSSGARNMPWPGKYRLSSTEPDGPREGWPAKVHEAAPTLFHGAPTMCSAPNAARMEHPTVPVSEAAPRTGDYFSNAPGVDIDRVAASIPQKDTSKNNLMKVALEAFNIRRSRRQARLPESTPSTSSSSKGSSPASSGSKKRQQQYL